MREISDTTPVFTITWLTQTGEEATVTGTPIITIKKYDADTDTWGTIINASNMTQESGSTYYYEWDASAELSGYDYRVFYQATIDGLTVNATEDFRLVNTPATQADVEELRFGNQRIDFNIATSINSTRNVNIGDVDSMTIYTKQDNASDWSSPTSTKTLYLWYDTSGRCIASKESD